MNLRNIKDKETLYQLKKNKWGNKNQLHTNLKPQMYKRLVTVREREGKGFTTIMDAFIKAKVHH